MKLSSNNYFTTEASIISAFEMLTSDHFDKRTLHVWIDYFKKCMYYASADYFNPVFPALAYDAIKKSDQYPKEFLYIHKLMYQFLCLGNDTALEFAPYTTDPLSGYEFTVFKWNVPSHTMPFLISYIKAANKFKKNTPITSFFKELNDTFTDTMNFQKELTQDAYLDLTDKILCRNYFCDLAEIYHTFAQNTEQIEIIRHSVSCLSQALIKYPPNNTPISEKAHILLTAFRKKLYAQTSVSKNQKLNLTSLYPHLEPWDIHGEADLMQTIKKRLSYFQEKLLSFIAENLDTNAPYHIAAKNYEALSEGCAALLDELKQHIETYKKEIFMFYFSVLRHPDIQNAIECGSLEPDYKKLYCCRELLTDSLFSYFNAVAQKTNTFKNTVKRASHACPEHYKSLIAGKNYFIEFKQSVGTLLNNLYSSNFMTIFDSSRPFLFYKNQGLINSLTYPYMLSLKDCLRLIYELTGLKYPLDENYIIRYFFTRQTVLPISLADFLSKFDDTLPAKFPCCPDSRYS